jgi:hypothetical protein
VGKRLQLLADATHRLYKQPADVDGPVFVQKQANLVEIKVCEKFIRRRPAGSALGVYMVDIPRNKL